ncbi:hypothetical protein [Longimicrobium sp.]|uniref:hypothetical protein n=1 Tax=Longimicrobium sp. TaxID=2029185 RepID=UPI002E370674|nr:hypothetical protein [Longimicrobium sp.]HEX6041490.1 hypothetical protein [Longimicrobium sp.]
MSEYQYYEFQAVDRSLSPEEMERLRAVSSRATITPRSFVNVYHYGNFRGDAWTFLETYFDAFLYLANWGTREVMLRVPLRMLGADVVGNYCDDEFVMTEARGEHVLLGFRSEDEGGDWEEDGSGRLGSLLPLREELAGGDHRALYLGWLLSAQQGGVPDEAPEPPVPAGLGRLTAAQRVFVDFLRIDEDLVRAAAERSVAPAAERDDTALQAWIAALPDAEKTAMLMRVANGGGNAVRLDLLAGVQRTLRPGPAPAEAPRTVGELLARADHLADVRQREEAEAAARAKARREQQQAAERERYLSTLVGREEEVWSRAEALAAEKKGAAYEEAVRLLRDLRDLAQRDGGADATQARLYAFAERHAGKLALNRRMKDAGLV